MKTIIASAAVLVATAATGFAATAADFDRFGVDADQLTPAQQAIVKNAISGPGTDSEISALVQSLVNNG